MEREPDVYVRTVLTFRNHPAPTMAITAMRKTAEMNKESNLKEAEAITTNAYVDISDSVLKTGGFLVKKWNKNLADDNKVQKRWSSSG